MKIIEIDEKEYKLEFGFEAAEYKNLVQKMFKILCGAYVVESANNMEEPTAKDVINGTASMVGDLPEICTDAFYAGLIEHNSASKEEAKALMREFMKKEKISFMKLYTILKDCMEDDGFFNLSGLTDMMEEMYGTSKPKAPQDHKKKQTSTK